MTFKRNTCEGGSDGTVLTAGNSGGSSGDAFGTVSTGTIAFSNAQAMHGTLSHLYTPTSGVTCFTLMNDGSSGLAWSVSPYFYLTGLPASETIWIDVQGAAGGTCARLHLPPTGGMKLVNNAGAFVSQFTTAPSLNTWYRVSFSGTVHATLGEARAALYAGDSMDPIETLTATAINTGSTRSGRVVYGKFTATGAMAPFYFDTYTQDLEVQGEILPPQTQAETTTHADATSLMGAF